MDAVKLTMDPSTGELLPQNISVEVAKPPAIIIDIDDVRIYHSEPEKLIEKIRAQSGYAVFDVSTEKGRGACRSHAANIIKCIAPALNASKQMAADAQKIVRQDLAFRRTFETAVREIADFHRKPLTDYENEQKHIEELRELAALVIESDRLYQLDHQEAIDYDELYRLRKARTAAEAKAALEQKALEDKRLFEEAVAREAEALRLKIQREEQAKAEAEQAARLESERLEIRAEEQRKARKATPSPYFKPDVEMITIPKAEYDELQERSARLAEIEQEFS